MAVETSNPNMSMFAGGDMEADCLTFVEEIEKSEVNIIAVC